MLALALAIATAQPSAVARDIDRFCGSRAKCVASQRESLRYFLNLMVVSGVTEAESKQCMAAAKRKRLIDWTVAESCIRKKAKGRNSIAPMFEERG